MKQHKLTKLTIKASQVARAMDSVKDTFDDWQAQALEVLLLPKMYRRWRELNRDHYDPEMLTVERVPGLAHRGFTREDNGAIGDAKDWGKFAGYVLRFYKNHETGDTYGWNAIKDNWYSHSPSCCWDGVRRDTIHQFIEMTRMIVLQWRRGESVHFSAWEPVEKAGIVLLNDLAVTS